MSHRYHMPPSVHSTFVADRFVVCTFVPRPIESDPGALKVPFFHSNDDFDEVIFYHAGDFFSRDNIQSRHGDLPSQRLHPWPASQGVCRRRQGGQDHDRRSRGDDRRARRAGHGAAARGARKTRPTPTAGRRNEAGLAEGRPRRAPGRGVARPHPCVAGAGNCADLASRAGRLGPDPAPHLEDDLSRC